MGLELVLKVEQLGADFWSAISGPPVGLGFKALRLGMMKHSSGTSSPNGPTGEPAAILYKRWKHKKRGYIVTVFAVRNYQGEHGFHSMVIVHDQYGKERQWAANVFLDTFSPMGRKLKFRRWWERI